MTTWTDATVQSETWTGDATGASVFDPLIFSHELVGGLRMFDLGSADGKREIWDSATVQSESWTPA